jgi:hypothetical protein
MQMTLFWWTIIDVAQWLLAGLTLACKFTLTFLFTYICVLCIPSFEPLLTSYCFKLKYLAHIYFIFK